MVGLLVPELIVVIVEKSVIVDVSILYEKLFDNWVLSNQFKSEK
jgi:hypothetical protein